MHRLRATFCGAFLFVTVCSTPGISYADISTNSRNGSVAATDRTRNVSPQGAKHVDTPHDSQRSIRELANRPSSSILTRKEKFELNNRLALQQQATLKSAVAQYSDDLVARRKCVDSGKLDCKVPAAPTFAGQLAVGLRVQADNDEAAPARVVLTPTEVAHIAFARLKLTAPKPTIGPPPDSNKWKMAVVGYPLWLWGDGNAHPAPVSDSVGGLFVSLDAHVSKIVFTMGDGTRVTCQGVGQEWDKSVSPGQRSPTCGHTYSKPSLPKGPYTVTATTYWSVAWNVTGVTGVIPFVQSASTTVPVGELQVLVR